jgi:hypothetical protein
MPRLGRRQPFAPIINTMIQFAPAIPAPVGKSLVMSGQAIETAKNLYHGKHLIATVKELYTHIPHVDSASRMVVVTKESVRRKYRRSADIYTPFIQTIRPPDPIKIPCLVPTDPNAPTRTREHCDLVSVILNSLIMQRELIRESGETARGTWKLGYVPAVYQNWGNPAPTTIKDALDQIAARLKALENP